MHAVRATLGCHLPRLAVMLILAGAMALVACQDNPENQQGPKSEAVDGATGTSECDTVLTNEERMELVGVSTDDDSEWSEEAEDEGCFWMSDEGPSHAAVSFSTVPAGKWAADKATMDRFMLDQDLVDPGRRRERRMTLRLLESAGRHDARACQVFVKIGELAGAAAGSRTVTRFVPGIEDDSPGVMAERCVDGAYTRLTFTGPAVSEDDVRLAVRILDEVSPSTSTG